MPSFFWRTKKPAHGTASHGITKPCIGTLDLKTAEHDGGNNGFNPDFRFKKGEETF
jgi:hypothetical protein